MIATIGTRLATIRHALRQSLCRHAWTERPTPTVGHDVPDNVAWCSRCDLTRPGVLRPSPRYAYVTGMERADRRFILHNPHLGEACDCLTCKPARRRRKTKPATVTLMRKRA